MATFNGFTIIVLPTAPAPRSIEFVATDIVGDNTSPFTGQLQIQNWQAAFMKGTAVMPPMTTVAGRAWIAALLALNGKGNIFQLGDPTRAALLGTGGGTPAVNGANQTGFTLALRGLPASTSGIYLPGDYLQVGYRLYTVIASVTSDGSGDALVGIWPNLRESPADGTAVVTANTQGIWRLDNNERRWNIVPGRSLPSFQFEFREAI
jgi:hypothetical protein